ncbi:MAG: GntR family transcriptional regulator [Candidatus Wallbacteria bacterium GWC2_49_35]|uniref:GntR family transcriptional regulator n=1 Tax=Candidatus Wallbacteria bacterium GWC2_49_35 TaxID=1817813 RepID=A0A1F7WT81_9BACT|nr:MAG: GntR family transcriptional regulator [Candidatus Wallbacteria bacterium GWC2_49_35]HBC73756.1 GntR family transcriptional regulator [Candidatus Wallbacteria bacterium]
MLKIGDYNTLKVSHKTDFGFYLDSRDGYNILLPNKYVPSGLKEGDEIEVFVYTDSEDRPIATTQKPLARAGEFACLMVRDVNDTGVFLDWGLEKNLLLPYSEAPRDLKPGHKCVVYVSLDKASKRIFASAKFDKHIEKKEIALSEGQAVKLMVARFTPNGVLAIIDDKYAGIIYESEIFEKINIGDKLSGFVKKVRPDNKIDLTIRKGARDEVEAAKNKIMAKLLEKDGFLKLNDKSSPDLIKQRLQMSKLTFKKAIGGLYKDRKILIGPEGISIAVEQ